MGSTGSLSVSHRIEQGMCVWDSMQRGEMGGTHRLDDKKDRARRQRRRSSKS